MAQQQQQQQQHAGSASGSASASSSSSGLHMPASPFGDTTHTKVFVGGLAWETTSERLRRFYERFGDILEAVVITDRHSGRSKGYGFVTFRDAESALRAVQDPNPVIAGRRANCNIASMGPPRPSPQRGRAPRGSHLPDQQPLGPPPYMGGRMQSQQQVATPPHAVFYPSQYGYWYPPEYTYQQAVYNSQLQHYYPQLYGPTSPSTSPYPYMGYMPGGPGQRAGFSPMQQAARPQFFQQPTAQLEGSFQTAPSLPPNFRLQLPPRAVSRQSDDISGPQSTQPNPETADTSTDNQEASTPVNRTNSDLNTSN